MSSPDNFCCDRLVETLDFGGLSPGEIRVPSGPWQQRTIYPGSVKRAKVWVGSWCQAGAGSRRAKLYFKIVTSIGISRLQLQK